MLKKHLSIIAKPRHDCNLSCKYCYLEEEAEKGIMSLDILNESVKKVSNFVEASHWIWHGGEPLLMGINFFKQVRDIQKFYEKKGHKFSNSIQTNGTLINKEILEFIKKEKDFYLGVSLDGPKEINDKTRVYPSGNGSFKEIINGIHLIKELGIRGGGTICVINSQNINKPQELYDFFKKEGINVKFNPLIKSGRAKKNLQELEITPLEYGNFLLQMWDIYNSDVLKEGKVTIDIDPFMEVIGNIATKIPLGCNYSVSCRNNFISIGPLGDIYPCGRFDGIKQFWMGNIRTSSIEEALNSNINQILNNKSLENISGCKTCNNKEICNSGCMHNAYLNGNVMGKDPYCVSYLKLFNKMSNVIKEELEALI